MLNNCITLMSATIYYVLEVGCENKQAISRNNHEIQNMKYKKIFPINVCL